MHSRGAPRNGDVTIDERLTIGEEALESLLEIGKLEHLQRIHIFFDESRRDLGRDTFDESRCPSPRCKRADRWLDDPFTAEVASCRDRKCERVDLWKARVRELKRECDARFDGWPRERAFRAAR